MKTHKYLFFLFVGIVILSTCYFILINQKKQEEMSVWSVVPLVNKENRKNGSEGGEGGQWPHSLEVSKSDSSLVLYGTNTGGIYRSENGGENWELSSQGLTARGCNAFAIDPINDQYILCAGITDNSGGDGIGTGIYLSIDRGCSWQLVMEMPISGNKIYTDGLEYDESSYNEEEQKCMRAYYSIASEAENSNFLEKKEGLYCSEDGGNTWELVNENISNAKLKINPSNGWIYAARYDGLYLSKNQGQSFSCIYDGEVTGFDISWNDKCIYICSENRLLMADTEKLKFSLVLSSSYPQNSYTVSVSVSPVNPNYLLIQTVENNQNIASNYQIYYSKDKGKHWNIGEYDESLDFFPYLSFPKVFAWSYEDENRVWSFGGEHVIRSVDGGANWIWNSQGICGTLCGGKFHFNIFDSDLIFLGIQDWNGALTSDGGETWEYMDVSGDMGGGHVYGGYAASENVFWGSFSKNWSHPGTIVITFDGGKTYIDTGKILSSQIANAEVSSYQSYNDPEVFFAGNYRSCDGGSSWKEMDKCLQVYTHNTRGKHELYGCENKRNGYVLVSYDDGKTWSRVNNTEIKLTKRNCISDIEIDSENMILYVAANGCELYQIDIKTGNTENLTENLPKDQMGKTVVSSVAVDLQEKLVLVAGTASTYNRTNTLLYSSDMGKTWGNLLETTYNGQIVEGAMCLDIQMKTGELWVATSCHGIAKLEKRYR